MASEEGVVIGVDAHKRTHTLVAADVRGRGLAQITVPATTAGHLAALEWATRWPQRRWAVEDCRHLTRRLEADLIRAGEPVLRVPTNLMADTRRSARERGKSDPIDALAVARAAWREEHLPVARLDGPQRQLRLLVDHRDALIRERTRVQNRIRWHLHELDPGLEPAARAFRSQRNIDRVLEHLSGVDGLVAELARELLERARELNTRARELDRRIQRLVVELAPSLLAIPGCGPRIAAKLVGETAGARRFHSKHAYARWNGTAPQPASSGNHTRHRLSRSGNRQVNAALHHIAITQARLPGLGRDYLDRRRHAGNTNREAIRLLRRRLSDVVYRALLADEPTPVISHASPPELT
jgi:transposase